MGQSPTDQCVFLHKNQSTLQQEQNCIIFFYSAKKYRVAKFFKFHKIMDHLFYRPLVPMG